ncbi:MAG: hypothetical protein AAGN15_15285 [Cyanobacteria bacterium J06581_3]
MSQLLAEYGQCLLVQAISFTVAFLMLINLSEIVIVIGSQQSVWLVASLHSQYLVQKRFGFFVASLAAVKSG